MTACFVAEVSSNHGRDLQRCLRFIDTAADIGCDSVKFQLFRVRDLFAPEILERSEEHRRREAWELPVDYLPELAARCRRRSVAFSCTPFSLEAVDDLLPHVDFYKVASYELLWDDLLRACARTGKPVVLSTGMATLDEVRHAVAAVTSAAAGVPEAPADADDLRLPARLSLLHCVSGYPTPADQCNLAAIDTLRSECGVAVGWSDHSVDPAVVVRAVRRWGADMVEFHLDLDGEGAEYQAGHCWLPEQMAAVITEVRAWEAEPQVQLQDPDGASVMDGTGVKEPAAAELADRDWRADPADGLRPLRHVRETWRAGV